MNEIVSSNPRLGVDTDFIFKLIYSQLLKEISPFLIIKIL